MPSMRFHDLNDAADEEIASWYDFGPGTTLRSNMVMSADGAAVSPGGGVGGLTGPADARLLSILRGVADALIVAAGTIRAEGYRPVRARPSLAQFRAERGMAEHPVLVIITRQPALDPGLETFTGAPVPPLILCERAGVDYGSAAEVIELPAPDGGVDLAAAKAVLAERGLRRQHSEGGPHLLGGLLSAGLLDEYCLALAPRLLSGEDVLRPVAGPTTPTEFSLAHGAAADDFLFLHYRRSHP